MKHLLIAVLLLAFPAMGFTEGHRPLRLVSDAWPPYVTKDSSLPGVDVEIALAVFAQMNTPVTFELLPWQRAQTEVRSGQADAIIAISQNEKRLAEYWFPETPISQSETTLFCRGCDKTQAMSADLLSGKTLILNQGYQYAGNLDELPEVKQLRVDSFQQGFTMLHRDRGDFFLVNRNVGLYTLQLLGYKGIVAFEDSVAPPSDIFLAFHRSPELERLSQQFSKILADFKTTESYRAILAKYGILP